MSTKLNGVELIAAERQRQIDVEGWSAQHDANHTDESLAMAAACYATPDSQRLMTYRMEGGSPRSKPFRVRVPSGWPWDGDWWKPCEEDRIRELVKAGALIAAEIDRIQRAGA